MYFRCPLRRVSRLFALSLALVVTALFAGPAAVAQANSPAHGDEHRILLVLPFDNKTGQPSLEWIREAAPEILNSRFTAAGFAPLSRADRLYALDHLGLPQAFQPSHASSLKIAQTLDADSIIVGSYAMNGNRIEAQAQIISVPHLEMSKPITAEGDLHDLIAVFSTLAWKITRQLDPNFNIALETFVAAGANVNLAAFEQYIRGITEPDQAERLKHLNEAVKLNPDFPQAWMALARADYSAQQYERAAADFAKVKGSDADALQAGFFRGLALMFSGDYASAEKAFANVSRVLPLPSVLNNEGVAISRQGHDGTALFRQAETADPSAPDYHFNLAVSLDRHGNRAAAQAELLQCLKLRPNDSEAQELQVAWRSPASAGSVEPLERIVRVFDEVAFRQAASMLDQMEETRLAALTPQQRAQTLAKQAREYLSRGLLLESERLYQQAIAADTRSQAAHLGLAEVRERTGDAAGARKEAQAAVELEPSADAYLVLARADLAAKRLDDAAKDAGEALKLSPGNGAAAEVLREVKARQGGANPPTR